MKYKILEGIARADVAYQIYGKTIKELFTNCAEVVEQTMVDITTVKPFLNSKFKIQNSRLEDLLLDFLNELVFLKDSRQLLLSKYQIKITLEDGRYNLATDAKGEKIDPKRHKLRCDVKAVTRHKFFLKKEKNKYIAQLVLDI